MKSINKLFDFKPLFKLKPLSELAYNIWTTWDDDACNLFNRINPAIYKRYNHNPVKLLQLTSAERFNEISRDDSFLEHLNSVYNKFKLYMAKKKFNNELTVAFLAMEYGLHESLPTYSGGLGILSGDHLKAASDLGLSLFGFGLLYRYGYFTQEIDINGKQKEKYEENDWSSKPVSKVKDAAGNDLILTITLNGDKVFLKVWQLDVGNIILYLLDSNLENNSEKYRKITDHLYVSDREMRFLQELTLAFGAFELIRRFNINPSVYHLNEGHSVLIIIKRLEKLIKKDNLTFEQAREVINESTVFTTHTPVPAGNENFTMELVRKYLTDVLKGFEMDFDRFSKFASIPNNNNFSFSALAIRFSKYINGVSELHSKVSKDIWKSIFPELTADQIPIHAITNGVHIGTWVNPQISKLFEKYPDFISAPDDELWKIHQDSKKRLIEFILESTSCNEVLNTEHLTVGFARRFATYKRATLILEDKQRLLTLLNHPTKPVHFVFAGKAHPADDEGKSFIKELIDFAREHNVENKFVFIKNYNMNVARYLVQGVDVWLNNPIKPKEASGTSGMKAGMNGVLNFSVLDGWWPECYTQDNGWAITAGENILDPLLSNRLEANEIYDILEKEIIPLYYSQNDNGLSKEWILKMKYSIQDVTTQFNMNRVIQDYINDFYLHCSRK